MQEIVIVIIIGLALFYIPRLRTGKARGAVRKDTQMPPLTGWMRLAILITFLWVYGVAAVMKPWNNNNLLTYLSVGVAPAFIFWGAVWVFFGYKKYRR
jgi:polyferredoxin